MKKMMLIRMQLICLLLISTSLVAIAQVEKGSQLAGGSLRFSSSGGDLYQTLQGNRVTSFNMGPFVDFFLTKGFTLGAELPISFFKWDEYSSSGVGLGLRLGYYFLPDETIRPYIFSRGIGQYFSNSSSDDGTISISSNIGLGILLGISPSANIVVEGVFVRDSRVVIGKTDVETGNIIALQVGFNVKIR